MAIPRVLSLDMYLKKINKEKKNKRDKKGNLCDKYIKSSVINKRKRLKIKRELKKKISL